MPGACVRVLRNAPQAHLETPVLAYLRLHNGGVMMMTIYKHIRIHVIGKQVRAY